MSVEPSPLKSAKPATLEIEPDRADVEGRRDLIVANVVKLELARGAAAQDHVGCAVAVEVAEAGDLKIEPHCAQRGGIGDVVVADVVDLECAGGGAAQQHVGGVAAEEAAQPGKLKIGSHLAQNARGQDRVIPDVVDLVLTGYEGGVRCSQDHVGGGAGRWKRIHAYSYIFQVRGYGVVVSITVVEHVPDICAGNSSRG